MNEEICWATAIVTGFVLGIGTNYAIKWWYGRRKY